MPRSTKDSDEELGNTKRRVTDSPLRRSTRNRQTTATGHNETSSPDSPTLNDTGPQQRLTRRRSAVMDLTLDNQRSLRPRKNSVSSDVSEVSEDLNPSTRKTGRKSVAPAASLPDTPRAANRRRLARAGSEAKSTPPVSRVTRRTRASSMGPESTTDDNVEDSVKHDTTEQPLKSRRRASVVPSQTPLLEEKEEIPKILVVQLDRTLPSVIENSETGRKNVSTGSTTPRVSLSNDKADTSLNNNKEEKMEVSIDALSGQKGESLAKELLEEHDKSISNKENQTTNIISDPERNNDSAVANVLLQSPKLSSPSVADKSMEERRKSQIIEPLLTMQCNKSPKVSVCDTGTLNVDEANLIKKEVETSEKQDAQTNDSMDLTNVELSVNNASTEESEVSLTLEHSNVDSPAEKLEHPSKTSNESVNQDKENSKHETSKVDGEEKLEEEKSAVINTTVDTSTNEPNDSTVMEIDRILEESREEGEISDQSVTEQKTEAKEDSEKMEISVEMRENDTRDSIDTVSCSNLSELATLETSDLLPVSKDQSSTNLSECTKEVLTEDKEKVSLNASSSGNSDSSGNKPEAILKSPIKNHESSITETSMKSVENEASKEEEETEKSASDGPTSEVEMKSKPEDTEKEVKNDKNDKEQEVKNDKNDKEQEVKNDKNETEQEVKNDKNETEQEVKDDKNDKEQEIKNDKNDKEQDVKDDKNDKEQEVKDDKNDKEQEVKDDKNDKEQEVKNDKKDTETGKNKETDSEANAESLFQDISADEWQRKRKKPEPEVNSVHSLSTEGVDNESETECDLILVDRDAWLAAENLKAEKENEAFDYDSDDTVILKSRIDSLRAQQPNDLSTVEEESEMDISQDSKKSNRRKSRASLPSVGENNVEEETKEDKTNEEDAESKEDASAEKSDQEEKSAEQKKRLSKVEDSEKSEEESESKLNKSALSEKSFTKRRTSLRKGKESDGVSLNKSAKYDDSSRLNSDEEPDPQLNKSALSEKSFTKKRTSLRKGKESDRVSLNKSAKDDDSSRLNTEDESEQDEKLLRVESASKKKPLNKSLTREIRSPILITPGSKKKSLSNSSSKRKVSLKRLEVDSSESESAPELNVSKKALSKSLQRSGKKNLSPNYSMRVQVGSGSDIMVLDSESEESQYSGRKIPKFLFNDTSSNDSPSDDRGSIDSDVKREYNLDGENEAKFSDDDVAGDECRASESEYSDPDDDGSDLADFVVDDDDEVEGEEENEEDEDKKEEEEERENSEVEDEEENVGAKRKVVEESEEEKEEEGEQEEESEEEKVKRPTPKAKKVLNISGSKRSKLKELEEDNVEDEEKESVQEEEETESNDEMADNLKSKKDRSKTNLSTDSDSSEAETKKKKRRSDQNGSIEDKKNDSAPFTSSSGKKKPLKKQRQIESSEDNAEEPLIEKSPMMFAKKMNKFNISADCSTPKSTVGKYEKFEITMPSPSLTLEGQNKMSEIVSPKKSKTTDMSLKVDTVSKKLNRSKELEKSLLHKSLPVDLPEMKATTNLSRPMSSKVSQLNKSMPTPDSDTPRAKFLKKDKLNDSLPPLKFEANKKLLRASLIKEKLNATPLSSTEIVEETEEAVEELKELRSPKLEPCLEEIEEDVPKKQKKRKEKKMNMEAVVINVEGNDGVVAKKKRKLAKVSSLPEVDSLEPEVTEKKKEKSKKKKQTLEKIKNEVADEPSQDEVYGEEVVESVEVVRRKKRKEKKKPTEDIPKVTETTGSTKAAKNKKLKPVKEEIVEATEKQSKKKRNMANEVPSKPTKVPKRFLETVDWEEEDEVVQAVTKVRNDIPKSTKETLDMKKKTSKKPKTEAEEARQTRTEPKKSTKVNKMVRQISNEDNSLKPPTKRRKLSRKEGQLLPSRSGFTSTSNNLYVEEEERISPSRRQSMTEFQVVDLQNLKKHKKKSNAVMTFKQRMLDRNKRQAMSAFLMYLKKPLDSD